MNIEMCVNTLDMPLPEDILKRKWAGDLDGAIRAIDMRLKGDLPQLLRARLECERERIRRLPTQYPWNRAQAIAKLQELVPGVPEEKFDELELAGFVDFIYVNGEKRYFVRFHRSLAKSGALRDYVKPQSNYANDWLDPMIAEARETGEVARRITLETGVCVDDEDFVPGKYLAHLPFPAETAQQSDIVLLEGDPDGINPPDAPARCAWWERELEENHEFTLRYSYTSRIRYADPMNSPAPASPLYPCEPAPCAEDLCESGAYIRFTPYLRALAQEITAGETTLLGKAHKIYQFVTTKITYTFMRDYFQFDNHGEYCAVNLKGDCGLQTLTFIVLCRIAGVPARWQSGLTVEPDYVGGHDWAQFYADGWGWLFADLSYGGSAYRAGNETRHAFYFGNLDPARMAANRRYQAEIEPKKQQLRVDPFDNQGGEMEREGAQLPYTMRQLGGRSSMIACERV